MFLIGYLNSGHVCRWGDKWFFEILDGGPGWDFRKDDRDAIRVRLDFLLQLFGRTRVQAVLALVDNIQEAIVDGIVGPNRRRIE